MALQGTIETFALPDVLRLLSSTKKTGCLRLDGGRGSGNLWVDSGSIVGGESSASPHAATADEVLFELLRFKDGDFLFDADADVQIKHSPADVEATLEAAEQMLEEWATIEAVVPSLDHFVALAPSLKGPEVVVSADRWKTIVAVAGGTSVGALGDVLELGELPVSRNVKELVELGLVTVEEPRAGSTAPPRSASAPTADSEQAPVLSLAPDMEGAPLDEGPVFDPNALVMEEAAPTPAPPTEEPIFGGAPPVGDADPSDAAEIARQLANLSPKAAKAVAAAAKATTPEERERALAEVDDEEDPINRDLLIKFLGSVNS